MLRTFHLLILTALLGFVARPVHGFALLGPLDALDWTDPDIGYSRPGDIGDPVRTGEEYRWTSPTIVYAYDSSFLTYFGQKGVDAVESAIKVFNDLPPASQIDLDIYPTDNRRINDTARRLGVIDLKSTTMSYILEILGLAQPERWVWALRGRDTETAGGITITNYLVIPLNYDPVTWQPTNRVNDAIYNYSVQEPLGADDYADAVETIGGDPFNFIFTSVAGAKGFLFQPGVLYTGLTRDDVGGWRYLLRRRNYNVEQLPVNTFPLPRFLPGTGTNGTGTNGGVGTNILGPLPPWVPVFSGTNLLFPSNFFNNSVSPWTPFTPFIFTNITVTNVPGGTNVVSTNRIPNTNVVNIALRPGIEKIRFVRRNFDSLLGQGFRPFTNQYTDTVISNFTAFGQRVERIANQPDLLFGVEDLGFDDDLGPFLVSRGNNWINNDTINGNTTLAGPGQIGPPMQILFTMLPIIFESTGPGEGFPTGPDPFDPLDPFFFLFIDRAFSWGSFDATPTPPVVFPEGASIQALEAQIDRED